MCHHEPYDHVVTTTPASTSPSATPALRSWRELPTASQPSWGGLCSLPHPQDSSQLHQAGWVLADISIGHWINTCYWHWTNEMSVSSTANWSMLICAADELLSLHLPEMIKRRKQPPVLPGSPEGDTLLGREREAQFKGSRWQRGFELGARCRNWEQVLEDFPSCSSAWFNLEQKINHRW